MKNEILLTSATGFLGRRLVAALEGRGFTVRKHASLNGDMANPALPREGVGHVFRLAGKSHVPDSSKDTRGFSQTNVIGCGECAGTLQAGIRGVFNTGSGRSSRLAQLVSSAAGIAKPVGNADVQRPGGVPDVFADALRGAPELGWRPHTLLAQGIAAVVAVERAARG